MRQAQLSLRRDMTLARAGVQSAGAVASSGLMVARTTASTALMPAPPPRLVSLRAVAGSLGITGPLSTQDRDGWHAPPSHGELSMLASLRDGADTRLHMSHGSSSGEPSHLRTALGWLRRFTEVLPSRVLFVPHVGAGDVHAAAYNEETFRLFAEFVRRHGSVRPGANGAVVSSAAISDYISAIRAFRSREAGYNLLVSGGNLRLPPQLKQMRREDGPAGARELQRALSARLLRRLCCLPAFDRRSFRGVLRWAVLWGGHNLLLRGGEFGCVDNKEFSPAYGLTLADCDWVAPCAETGGYQALVVDMMVIKDERVTRARTPCLIRRRQSPGVPPGADPCCAYDALRSLWEMRVAQVPRSELSSAPLFATPDGAAVTTAQILSFVREAAAAVGEQPGDFDSRSLRIGGATDLYHLFGPQEAERLIAARGRWCSLIHQIYTRLSATSMLTVSSVMADATGVDLEAFRHGYVMPAVVRARRW
mmetsp:Transcript_35760/g.86829  ORF Transcript_35760/g.86829 Transcript_35760/m.86829 type:complete len:479 (-) Transcript_35760:433-1869(-)